MMKLLKQLIATRNTNLTPEQIADVIRIRENLGSGRTRLATDDEVAALWKKCGL